MIEQMKTDIRWRESVLSTAQNKRNPQEEIKMKGERSSEENEKKQTSKFIKTQECNVLTKYDISVFK